MIYLKEDSNGLNFELQRALAAVDGYLELGMPGEALRELNGTVIEDQFEPATLRARVRVLLHLKRWKDAEALSQRGISLHPEDNEFMVQRAFALHQLKRGDEAAGVLLSAPTWIRQTGILHYNLACYEAKLGDIALARQCLQAALELNSGFKESVRNDPDLQQLWS
jgi:tetratricopeptide (TPR) repeat protein